MEISPKKQPSFKVVSKLPAGAMKNLKFVKVVPINNLPKKVEIPQSPPQEFMEVQILSEEEEDDLISCQLCDKKFMSVIALRNHVNMQHVENDVIDITDWVPADRPEKKPKVERPTRVKVELETNRRQDIVSEMQPMNITSLASVDVDYIIVKEENLEVDQTEEIIGEEIMTEMEGVEIITEPLNAEQRKRLNSGNAATRVIHAYKKTNRTKTPASLKPYIHNMDVWSEINGPFECMEPSNQVADGMCHQVFFSCCDYSIHYRDDHSRRRKAIRCQVCEKLLNPVDGQNEDTIEPYMCQVCGKGFKTYKEVTEHINDIHIKVKPFECGVCHKRFTQQGGVQQHMRMHTGIRPFVCSFCNKSFTQKSGLDQHLRIHTKIKPYRCIVCAKAFCQSVHLKQHMRTHTNVAPFQCVICDKKFKQSSHLTYHLKNHNENNMTEEQKEKYNSIIGMVNQEYEEMTETAESDVTDQLEVKMEQMDNDSEQAEAVEQIIVENDQFVIDDNREYVLSDNGDETWSVKIVGQDGEIIEE